MDFLYWFSENWKDLCETISALVVAGCAWNALHTWKKEFIGKKKIEFAAEFVEKAIEYRNFLNYVRNGFSNDFEQKEIEEKLKKENELIFDDKLLFLVPRYRLLKNDNKLKDFYHLKTKAYMYFGEDALYIYKTFNKVVCEITIASEQLYKEDQFLETEKRKYYEGIIWGGLIEGDSLSAEINAVIDELKVNLEPLYQDKDFKWKKLK